MKEDEFTPDSWVVFKDTNNITRLLAGFTKDGIESWRMIDNVKRISKQEHSFTVSGQGKIKALCYKDRQGHSALTHIVFSTWQYNAKQRNNALAAQTL